MKVIFVIEEEEIIEEIFKYLETIRSKLARTWES
jgi:hypothetical protein